MRRHVETQIENPEKERYGIIIFFAVWVLALLVLTASARGEENGPQSAKPVKADGAQQIGTDNSRQSPASQAVTQRRPSPHRLPVPRPKRPKVAEAAETQASQPDSNNQETLTRFILISIPDRRLALVDDGQVIKVFPIAVGASHTPSPDGNFTIISHVANPSWTHKGKVMAPGKDNPVGSRWMGLSLKGYGIHGTNAPRSIGKAASHGCFRMGKKDVEELFTLVRVGDTVAVRASRDELVADIFGPANSAPVQVAAAETTATVDADQE